MSKRKRRWPVIVLVVFLVLISGVIYLAHSPKQLAKVILPDLSKVEEVEALIKNDSLHLNARGLFQSETFFPLVVDSLAYSFFVEDSTLYETKKHIGLHLMPGESDTVNIGIHVPFDRIRSISAYIHPMDSIMIGINCEVVYKYLGKHIRLKFKKEGKIARPVPPRIKLAGIGKKKVSDWGKNIETEAKLMVINDNKRLDVTVTDLKYDIVVGDKIKGHGKYLRPIVLKPQTTIVINIPVSLQLSRPLKSVYALLFKKDQVYYTLHATAVVDFHSKKQPGIKVDLVTTGNADFSLKK